MNRIGLAALAAGSLSFALPAIAQPTATDLGVLPGTFGATASGLSANGRVVVGFCPTQPSPTASFRRGFVWSDGEMSDVGRLAPWHDFTGVTAISGDGFFAFGHSGLLYDGYFLSFHWTQSAGMQTLSPPIRYLNAIASTVSDDGRFFAGSARVRGSGEWEPFRWVPVTGFEAIELPPGTLEASVSDMSADGSVLVGGGYWSDRRRGFRWTQDGGHEEIGQLQGALGLELTSADDACDVIVGNAYLASGGREPIIWTPRLGTRPLGVPPGFDEPRAEVVSGNGSVIGGSALIPASSTRTAVLWLPSVGMVEAKPYLEGLGADLSGWELLAIGDLSRDGTTLVANGMKDGQKRSVLIRDIPIPPRCSVDLDGDFAVTVFDFLAFQNLFDAGDPAADFDGDGEFTIFDFLAFSNAFDLGCS